MKQSNLLRQVIHLLSYLILIATFGREESRKGGTKKALLRVAGCINLFLSQERGEYALKERSLNR